MPGNPIRTALTTAAVLLTPLFAGCAASRSAQRTDSPAGSDYPTLARDAWDPDALPPNSAALGSGDAVGHALFAREHAALAARARADYEARQAVYASAPTEN